MTDTTTTRSAQRFSTALALSALATVLTLASAGTAEASPILRGSARQVTTVDASTTCHGSHLLCPNPRLYARLR